MLHKEKRFYVYSPRHKRKVRWIGDKSLEHRAIDRSTLDAVVGRMSKFSHRQVQGQVQNAGSNSPCIILRPIGPDIWANGRATCDIVSRLVTKSISIRNRWLHDPEVDGETGETSVNTLVVSYNWSFVPGSFYCTEISVILLTLPQRFMLIGLQWIQQQWGASLHSIHTITLPNVYSIKNHLNDNIDALKIPLSDYWSV